MSIPGQWDDAYDRPGAAPWDIGRPQPAFARLAAEGRLRGRVLDAGCGTGEQVLLAAGQGAAATGVDISGRAIAAAERKAAQRGLPATFRVGDALDPAQLGADFDTVLDCGLFHVFDDASRARYVASLAAALRPGGTCYLLCFSDRQPGDFGPRRIRAGELRAAFGDGWDIAAITAETFDISPGMGDGTAQAWLAVITRA